MALGKKFAANNKKIYGVQHKEKKSDLNGKNM